MLTILYWLDTGKIQSRGSVVEATAEELAAKGLGRKDYPDGRPKGFEWDESALDFTKAKEKSQISWEEWLGLWRIQDLTELHIALETNHELQARWLLIRANEKVVKQGKNLRDFLNQCETLGIITANRKLTLQQFPDDT